MSPTATFLSELIRYESVSSTSNCDVTRFAANRLKDLRFEIEEIPYKDARGIKKLNIVAKRAGNDESGRAGGFGYCGHTDVVPAPAWTGPGSAFVPTIDAGRLYGRGSCDMKGSIAAMFTAIESVPTHELPFYVILTADEEVGMQGANEVAQRSQLFKEMVDRDAAVVIGEPTDGSVVHGHKGYAVWTATALGRAGHSSTREGESATLKLMPFLASVAAVAQDLETDPACADDRFDPPTPTLNAVIRDEAPALNVTSPRASVQIFARVSTTFDPEPIDQRLRGDAERCGVELTPLRTRPAIYRDPDNSYFKEFCEVVESHRLETVSYGTDGSCLGDLSRLAIYGPGSIAQAHTTDEFIELAALEEGVKNNRRLIQHFAGGST